MLFSLYRLEAAGEVTLTELEKTASINSKSSMAFRKSNHSTRLKYWKAAVLRNGSLETSELHSELPARRYVGYTCIKATCNWG